MRQYYSLCHISVSRVDYFPFSVIFLVIVIYSLCMCFLSQKNENLLGCPDEDNASSTIL